MDNSQLYKALHYYFPFGFHISRRVWENLDILELAQRSDTRHGGSALYLLRLLSKRFNERFAGKSQSISHIYPGQLISVSVIVDVLRFILSLYAFGNNKGSLSRGLEWVRRQRGREVADRPLPDFVRVFPPRAIMREEETEDNFLVSSSQLASNNETTAGEMLLLSLMMENPAFMPFREFFDDTELKKRSPYQSCVEGMEQFLSREPVFEPLGISIIECLRAPMKSSPNSLDGQIDYMRRHWAKFLPPELLEQLLLISDILKEENLLRGIGPGPNVALDLRRLYGDYGYPEPAAFSRDADWMSNVVIIAKSAYVWLDQLSKKHGRSIRNLNDIPDEELDRLARWGFTGLWLIGLWERSPASQKIKQMTGNPEAVSSAYSLYDYVIAADLGGEEAYQNLRERAWQRGIRLASDMVPNHMGIYSKWVIEHPDWFLQLPYPPFPVYQFNGEDLSWDERVLIQIEDGYWDRRDAAVVFKRTDKWSGDVRYIYHGNDGTSMPWNDTAQLDFTKAEVREAVIQTIIHVARKFPIIRFDAAMTLAKKHYQRLWFPIPGEGGAIPSRAEYGLARIDFDKLFPKEFWREVVDRVASEVPDTLLIAEAFWLMEGYFVRTLGMHRVYNSAFMNMLKMEDNSKYRTTVKNVLEFSPEVIKRFVNFMNNPDERTAVEQFGKGDKYFGVAAMMVTMPGLPMFGHGQIEGFTEKYGMEYQRAYWNEPIDEEMVRRHEIEIFPLMRRRRLFSGAANFAFYDFITSEGWVDENVFAFSNRVDNERAIVFFNNAYNTTRGKIHTSTRINVGPSENPNMMWHTLAEALNLNTAENIYYRFHDYKTGLEYLRSGRQLAEEGLFAELHAYQYHVFLDFEEIYDSDGSWRKLSQRLEGAGVPDLSEALREMELDSILIPFRELFRFDIIQNLQDRAVESSELTSHLVNFYGSAAHHAGVSFYAKDAEDIVQARLSPVINEDFIFYINTHIGKHSGLDHIIDNLYLDENIHCLYTWLILDNLPQFIGAGDAKIEITDMIKLFDDWMLVKAMVQEFDAIRGNYHLARLDMMLVETGLKFFEILQNPALNWGKLLLDKTGAKYLQLNQYEGIFWVNKDQYERLIKFILVINLFNLSATDDIDKSVITGVIKTARLLLTTGEKARYQAEKITRLLTKQPK